MTPCISSRQSSGSGSRLAMVSREPAMDLIGARELLSSCPSTRTRRCQACSSSSRSGRVRSVSTRRRCGKPPSRNELRLMPQRPEPPGNTRCTVLTVSSSRYSARPNSRASSSSIRSDVLPRGRSPARLTKRSFCFHRRRRSTRRSLPPPCSSVVSSSAPKRWDRIVAPIAFTWCMTSARASAPAAPLARTE